jgi:transcriptional regulator with XRE-family HTH domain
MAMSSTMEDVRRRRRRALVLDRMAELHLSQTDLGTRAGLSKSAVTRILKGDRNPQTRTLEQLAAALEVPLAHLVDPPERPHVAPQERDTARRAVILTSGGQRSPDPSDRAGARADEHRQSGLIVWYPVYLWGMRVDPRRHELAPAGSFHERPVPVGAETERIGAGGFGLHLNDDSLSNWEGAEGQSLGCGWIVWCDPQARAGVQDGDLVVAGDPARGLIAGVYRQVGEEAYLETDDAGLREQERRRTEPGHVLGPVAMATLVGGVPRRRGRRAVSNEMGS